jgi:tetratricopeptide (TPR) repeat protein
MSEIVDRLLPYLLENRELNQKGIQLLQKAHQQISRVPKDERNAEQWFVLGYYAQQIQDYDDAQAHYTESILKNPQFEAAYKFRAAVCIDTQQFEDAQYDLEKALALDSSYTDAMFELARLYHEQDDNDKAVAQLQTLIEKDAEYSDAYALLGSTLEKTGKYESAIEAFNKAIELDEDSAHYFTQRGLAHYFAGHFDAARIDLEKVQKLSGINHITQFNLGLVLGELEGGAKDAFRNFERAFKRAPDMLNQFYKQSGKTEKVRLESRLEALIAKHNSEKDLAGSQFYREQLVQLLERKLVEAKNQI